MLKQFLFRGAVALSAALVSLMSSYTAFAARPISTQPNLASLNLAAPSNAAPSNAAPGNAAPGNAAPSNAAPSHSALAATRPPVPGIVVKLRSTNERLSMIVNTSRIIELQKQMPQVQVNNPDIVQLTVLSPTQVQISAKEPGVTQVNLWDKDNQIYTIDLIVLADARELQELLNSMFPNISLKVTAVKEAVVISGFVDRPGRVPLVISVAEEYYPKVINNIVVGGVHQVLLHCKVMEVSRTKLRQLGFDFSFLSGDGSVTSTPSQISLAKSTLDFTVLGGGSTFAGYLEALREDKLMKILAEPTLLCYSGRPASFQVGGEFAYPVSAGYGMMEAEWKKYGTKLDFVPIVLGNGKIRLEVRPEVSERDYSDTVNIGGVWVPAVRTRTIETGVEMNAGQTLAIAGLLQTRIDSQRRGLPWISEIPYVGALFGSNRNEENEIELLITVTPELVDAMNPDEVPACSPGTRTDSPDDCELYLKRYIEVPKCCPPGSAGTCPECNKGMEGQMPGMIIQPTPAETIDGPVGGQSGSMLLQPTAHKSPYLTPGSGNMPGPRNVTMQPRTAYRQVRPVNRYLPSNPNRTRLSGANRAAGPAGAQQTLPGFIGPVGYDVVK